MQSLRTLLPSVNALLVFEAAARLLSFTQAARELGVTQPAVSHSIRQIEGDLGVALFHRGHRSLRLTDSGERFFQDVSIGLAHIRQSARELRQSAEAGRRVTLSISTAFATYWLLPRMADFRAAHPTIDLRFQTTSHDVDLNREGIGLGIRQGSGRWPRHDAWHLVEEEVTAVCGPDYLRQRPGLQNAADLPGETLIHLEEPHRTPLTWPLWLDAVQVPVDKLRGGLRLNDYAVVIQAALAGQGVALGWLHLVQPLLDSGLLVPAVPQRMHTGNSVYVVSPSTLPMTEPTAQVRDWLLAQARPSGRDAQSPTAKAIPLDEERT